MTLQQLAKLFADAGCVRLYAKPLAENDNSKNQVYFAGAVEALNEFPSVEIYAKNTKDGPSFKAQLNFAWLLEDGRTSPAPHAQLILYSQYPEVRFSGFLLGCREAPSKLMMDRDRARVASAADRAKLVGRVLFMGVTSDRRLLGFVAPGNSDIANEFRTKTFPQAFVVFSQIPLPSLSNEADSKKQLLEELSRIHHLGWIRSKQLGSSGIEPCEATQCGGFTLEAEMKIPKNSASEPDYKGWEVKQYHVTNLMKPDSGGSITLMTPEPTGGLYREKGAEAFVRSYGYIDKGEGKVDRMNFNGIHRAGMLQSKTLLTMVVDGYDLATQQITDAEGSIRLIDGKGNTAAAWPFAGLLTHWSRKHSKAVYVPSKSTKQPELHYSYGGVVRLAQGTDSLKLLKALAMGQVYYDPGIKLENASSKPKVKKRSQFRVASKNISVLYEGVEYFDVSSSEIKCWPNCIESHGHS